jgi:hypothetical protein
VSPAGAIDADKLKRIIRQQHLVRAGTIFCDHVAQTGSQLIAGGDRLINVCAGLRQTEARLGGGELRRVVHGKQLDTATERRLAIETVCVAAGRLQNESVGAAHRADAAHRAWHRKHPRDDVAFHRADAGQRRIACGERALVELAVAQTRIVVVGGGVVAAIVVARFGALGSTRDGFLALWRHEKTISTLNSD